MTTVTAATWPTTADLEHVTSRLNEAVVAIEDLGNLSKLADDLFDLPADEVSVPSLESFGALAWCIAALETDLSTFSAYLDDMKRARDEAALRMTIAIVRSGDAS